MPYGTIKIDTITFTNGGVDKSVPVSGLVQNPTFTGNVTVTGTISGNIIQGGTTVSGLTVTGTTANFASGVFTTQISGVTITGTTVSTTTGNFTSLTGTTATITSGIIASGTALLPSLAILLDPDTGIYSPGANQLAVATNGVERVKFGTTATEVVFNDGGADYDFRVESDLESQLFFIDASDNSIGVGTAGNYGDGAILVAALARATGAGTTNVRLGIGVKELTSGQGRGLWLGARTDENTGVIGTRTASGNLAFETYNGSWGERMRLTYDGRLLVGTTNTIAGATDSLLQIRGNSSGTQFAGKVALATEVAVASIVSGTDLGAIYFGNTANGVGGLIECKGDAQWSTAGGGDYPGRLVFSTTADGAASPTERMRITNAGFLKASNTGSYQGTTGTYHELINSLNNTVLFVKATNASYSDTILFLDTDRSANSTYNSIYVRANGTGQFSVRGDGVIFAQNTTVQSTSDARVKENVQDSNEGLNVIKQLRPVRFDFKEGFGNNRKNQLGFIAQEVETVFPDAVDVSGETDETHEPYKTVGPASFIPVLVKALQEAMERIEQLETEMAAVKAQLS